MQGDRDGRRDAVNDADDWPSFPGAQDLVGKAELTARLRGRDADYAAGYRKTYREQLGSELAKAYRPHLRPELAKEVARLVLDEVNSRNSPSHD